MSVDQLTEQMRSQLLTGARRRVRHERRRRRVTSAVAALAVVTGVVAAIVFSRDPATVTTVATTTASPSSVTTTVEDVAPTSLGPPIVTAPVKPGGPAEFAVCDQYLSLRERTNPLSPLEKRDWDEFASAAAATSDADLAKIAAAAGDTWTDRFTPENAAATKQLTDHCTAIGNPSHNPTFVPIELAPRPAVELSRFGEEQAIEFTGEPQPIWQKPIGRGISAVQAGTSRAGAYVMYWSYLGNGGRPSYCLAYGRVGDRNVVGNGGYSGCGSDDPRDALYFSQLGGAGCCLTSLHTTSTTSFVVMETGGERFVQRPAARTAVIVWSTPPADRSVTAREYDVNGRELRCHGAC